MVRAAALLVLPLFVSAEWQWDVNNEDVSCGDCSYSTDGSGSLTVSPTDCDGSCKVFNFKWRDELTNVPGDLFDGQSYFKSRATTFRITHNKIETVGEDLFQGFSAINSITLKDNRMMSVPEGIIANVNTISLFQLMQNKLTSLPAGLFQNGDYTNLRTLALNHNLLESIPEGLLDGLTVLDSIHLGGNRFTTIPANLFADNTELTLVNLGDSYLAEIPDGLFSGLTYLRDVGLGNMRLTVLSKNVFQDNVNLDSIALGGNQFTSLPAGIFDGLTTLTDLNLRGNNLMMIPDGLFNIPSLKFLDLSENDLKSLPTSMFDPLSLKAFIGTENPFECKVTADAEYVAMPLGYESLEACVDKDLCLQKNQGTKDHVVIEINDNRHTVKDSAEECNQLCWDTPNCELWTFRMDSKTCTVKFEGPDFAGFLPKHKRVTGYKQDPSTWDSTYCDED